MKTMLWAALGVVGTMGLAACGTPSPPARLVHLPSALPQGVVPGVASARVAPEVWQLLWPLRVPEYLDRDALLVPQGQAGLVPLPGWRWAEPLRESVPRVLREDLGTLLGASNVWTSPLPAGVVVQRQLRVELLSFEASSDRREVQLRARWTLSDAAGTAPAQTQTASIRASAAAGDGDALAAAHRLALWRLAERIAAR